jgi:hypothetical protein
MGKCLSPFLRRLGLCHGEFLSVNRAHETVRTLSDDVDF